MSQLKPTIIALMLSSIAVPSMAEHANPWMGADDKVLAKNHDTNQARSIGTPGQDEMKGAMTRSAFGKVSGKASKNSGLADRSGGDAAAAGQGASGQANGGGQSDTQGGGSGQSGGEGHGNGNGNGHGNGGGKGGGRGKA